MAPPFLTSLDPLKVAVELPLLALREQVNQIHVFRLHGTHLQRNVGAES
jgi:hypothetical protein